MPFARSFFPVSHDQINAQDMTKSSEMASAEDSPASKSPRQRWLVTGASGRVGRMLWRQWEMEPPAATMLRQVRKVVPEAPTDIQWNPLIQPIPADAGRVDCLIAYAGVTPGHGAELAQNAALAEATLAAARAAAIPRVLLTSSSAIYGASRNGLAFTEADQPRPDNIYGRSKLSMEAVCDPWRARGLEVCCLRIGNVAGADQLLLNGLQASGKPLTLDRFHDGGGPIRSYVGAATLARAEALLRPADDLARAYVDMGDVDGAREILHEVLEDGSQDQVQEANELLRDLAR